MGVDRVLKFAFELAQSRPKKHLTSATKSNGISISMPYWDERVAEMAKNYPGIQLDKFHIDILTAHFVQRPDFFDVVVASNLFGDILSDLGPACTGTIGIAPSANLNPERKISLAVRAGAWVGARHRGPQHRQSHRPDLVRCNDAGVSGTQGRARRHPGRDRKSAESRKWCAAHARHGRKGRHGRCGPAPSPRRWGVTLLESRVLSSMKIHHAYD